jgi:hypothetical protein
VQPVVPKIGEGLLKNFPPPPPRQKDDGSASFLRRLTPGLDPVEAMRQKMQQRQQQQQQQQPKVAATVAEAANTSPAPVVAPSPPVTAPAAPAAVAPQPAAPPQPQPQPQKPAQQQQHQRKTQRQRAADPMEKVFFDSLAEFGERDDTLSADAIASVLAVLQTPPANTSASAALIPIVDTLPGPSEFEEFEKRDPSAFASDDVSNVPFVLPDLAKVDPRKLELKTGIVIGGLAVNKNALGLGADLPSRGPMKVKRGLPSSSSSLSSSSTEDEDSDSDNEKAEKNKKNNKRRSLSN